MIKNSEGTKPRIDDILSRRSSLWTLEEKGSVQDFLLWRDPYNLALGAEKIFFKKGKGNIPIEYGVESFNLFLDRLADLLGRYDPARGTLEKYLRTCLYKHCLKRINIFWKRRHGNPAMLSIDDEKAALLIIDKSIESNPDLNLKQRELQRAIADLVPRAFSELPIVYRESLILFLQGKDYKAIAEELDVSVAVVKNRLHRARQRLLSKLIRLKSDI
jgi:RNA polymerase sigma factor (sigma-70 family)